MTIVRISFQGPQGSGKTRLLNLIEKFLKSHLFNVIIHDEAHEIDIVDPIETLNRKGND